MYDFEKREIERKAYDVPLSEHVRGDPLRAKVVQVLCEAGMEKVGELATTHPTHLAFLLGTELLDIAKDMLREAWPAWASGKRKSLRLADMTEDELRSELYKVLRREASYASHLAAVSGQVASLKLGLRRFLSTVDSAIDAEGKL